MGLARRLVARVPFTRLKHPASRRISGALALAAAATLLGSTEAPAQRTRFEALAGCERYAAVRFRRHDAAFRRFIIDRSTVAADKFADKAGNQFVSTVYHGKALYEAAAGPKRVSFICLQGGTGRGAVFVYTLGE
jgi:hypothetical protein